MKKFIKALVVAAALTVLVTVPAMGSPLYWFNSVYTASHGWVVKAGNHSYTNIIRTRCHWYAGGTSWHTNWVIYPGHTSWTTSDTGSWGDSQPVGLRCSYSII